MRRRQRPVGQRHRAIVAGEQSPHPVLVVGEVERAQRVAVGDDEQLADRGRVAGQGQLHRSSFGDARAAQFLADASSPRAGGFAVDGAVEFVEAADAAEPRGERDLGHRQLALVDQDVGGGEALGLGDGDRRRADMLAEQSPHLPLAEAEPVAEGVDADLDPGDFVEPAAVDQRQCAPHARRRPGPRGAARRGVGAAALARTVAGGDGLGGGGDERHVPGERRPRRADRAAEDAGRPHAGEEASVGARVARHDRGVAGGGIEGPGVFASSMASGDIRPLRRRRLAVFVTWRGHAG